MTQTTQVQSASCHPWKPGRSLSFLAVNLYLPLWIGNSGTGTRTTENSEALMLEEHKIEIGLLEANRAPMKDLPSDQPCL